MLPTFPKLVLPQFGGTVIRAGSGACRLERATILGWFGAPQSKPKAANHRNASGLRPTGRIWHFKLAQSSVFSLSFPQPPGLSCPTIQRPSPYFLLIPTCPFISVYQHNEGQYGRYKSTTEDSIPEA